jgi:cyclopropane fatty-acyl-phospholipid synthase-like methyltransferase
MGYYAEKLSAKRLQRCYEIASPRVQQYLEAEIEHVIGHLKPTDTVLELGCGYGRGCFSWRRTSSGS